MPCPNANSFLSKLSLLLFVTMFVPACNDSVPPPPRGSSADQEPVHLCYVREATSVKETVRLVVTPGSSGKATIQGELQGSVSNPGAGYVAEYRRTLEGELSGDSLQLSITTVAGNTDRTTSETWQRQGDRLIAGAFAYTRTDCPAP